MASGAYVQGLREAVKALESLGVEADDLKAVFNPLATKAAGIIRANTPEVSGRLVASVKPNNAKNKAIVRAGAARVPYAYVVNRKDEFMQSADAVLTPEVLAAQVQQGFNDLIDRYGLSQ